MKVISFHIPKEKPTYPFIASLTAQKCGYGQFPQSPQRSSPVTETPEDLATRFTTFYDPNPTSLPAEMIVSQPPPNASRRIKTPTIHIAKTPFLNLALWDLLYATIGIILTITAPLATVERRSGPAQPGGCGNGSLRGPKPREGIMQIDDSYTERKDLVMRVWRLVGGKIAGGDILRQILEKEEEARRLLR